MYLKTKPLVLDQSVKLRLSQAKHAALQEAAKASGQSTPSFLLSLALEGAGVRPFFADEDLNVLKVLVAETRKIGVKINQMARAINSRRVVHPDEIKLNQGKCFDRPYHACERATILRRVRPQSASR